MICREALGWQPAPREECQEGMQRQADLCEDEMVKKPEALNEEKERIFLLFVIENDLRINDSSNDAINQSVNQSVNKSFKTNLSLKMLTSFLC